MHRSDYRWHLAIGYRRLPLAKSDWMYSSYSIWVSLGIYSSWKRQRSILYQELIVLLVQIIYNSFISHGQYSIYRCTNIFAFESTDRRLCITHVVSHYFQCIQEIKTHGRVRQKILIIPNTKTSFS